MTEKSSYVKASWFSLKYRLSLKQGRGLVEYLKW
jgi:hypothetical protein